MINKNMNPLQNLILQEDINQEALASILGKFVKIIPSDGKIIPLPDYNRLKNKEQVIVMVLAFKAAKELGFREKEDVSPKEIQQTSQMVGSTLRGILGDLVAEKIATRERGEYKIPNFLLYNIREKFDNIDLLISKKREKSNAFNKRGKTRKDFSRIKDILEANQNLFTDWISFLTETRGKYLKKALLILKIAKEKFSVDGLTPAEITEILKNKIRVPRIHQSNISLYLGDSKNSKHVFRELFRGGYIYKLTKPGEDFVNNMDFQLKEE